MMTLVTSAAPEKNPEKNSNDDSNESQLLDLARLRPRKSGQPLVFLRRCRTKLRAGTENEIQFRPSHQSKEKKIGEQIGSALCKRRRKAFSTNPTQEENYPKNNQDVVALKDSPQLLVVESS